MEKPSLSLPPAAPSLEDRLDSWKEIAAYLKRDVTTVQRWEKREGMPVHRHLHDNIGSVYAYRTELDAWTRTRNVRAGQESEGPALPPDPSLAPPQPGTSASLNRWRWLLPIAAACAVLVIGSILWLRKTERFWQNPIARARFQTVTDFAGLEQAAALSRDGHLVAFLSDRAGPMDIWITQVGSGEFHNLTHGTVPGLVNPSIRNLAFSPDGALVTYWFRRPDLPNVLLNDGHNDSHISVWAIPVLGGEPRPYLAGVAEYDWSHDGSRLAYHTPGPGDPLFVSDGSVLPENRPILTAPAGQHSHFPLWSPDAQFLYFVRGSLPDKLDIWRVRSGGGTPERITAHNALVSHPVLLDQHTLMYLASDADGSGPWLYSTDVDRRMPHRLTTNLDRYTSLAASADGRRLVATFATPKKTLWRLQIHDAFKKGAVKLSQPTQIALTTSTGFSPRLGSDYLLYASATGTNESIWKLAQGNSSELWRGEGAQFIGGPAVSPDGRYVAFSVRQHERSELYVLQADGTNAHLLSNSLDLQGALAWSPDGQSITSAAVDHGVPHLFRVPIDGRAPTVLIREYSIDPEWSPDGRFVIYSGPDVGTTFSVKAANPEATPHRLPALTLTRGARHLAFLPGGHALVMMRGDIQHKDLWLVDLETGAEQRLTELPLDFDIRDFDLAPDAQEVVMERVQETSNVVLLDLPRP